MGHIIGQVAPGNTAAHPRKLASCMPLLCQPQISQFTQTF